VAETVTETATMTRSMVSLMEARALLGGDLPFVDPKDFWKDYEAAKRAALESGWTGGSQGEPRVFWLPNPHAAMSMAAVKLIRRMLGVVTAPLQLAFNMTT
jgi:hypothetical protein